jgi:hypothetical protein
VLLSAGGDGYPLAKESVREVPETSQDCCVEVVASAPGAVNWAVAADLAEAMNPSYTVELASSRAFSRADRVLPVGKAPESGLQVKTILLARAVSAAFPEISTIGGVRPDALRWHPNGLALDVMIPNHGTAQGIALGNEIVAFAMKNAERFDLQDAIWRGVYYTPGGSRAGGYGHYDHVHLTTRGGGYPTGAEVYLR